MRTVAALVLIGLFCLGALTVVGFATPWGNRWRIVLAETILSTRHAKWARWITTPAEYAALLKQMMQAPVKNTNPMTGIQVRSQVETVNPVEVIPVRGSTYTGYVMLVHDSKLVRLVHAHVVGENGEYITDMGRRVGAIAGTNASGFEDPHGNGWGGIPVGLVYVDGQVLSRPIAGPGWVTVGFTRSGVLVMGDYSVAKLRRLDVRDAMQFHPELVVDGQPMITHGDGGWGYDPRTAIGQRRDGTVIFVVLNGRFHGGSGPGASLRQVMDLMLQYGAVNACAMDGGSSSVLYHDGRIVNSPSTIDPRGQRRLPDAWMVFPSEAAADAYHPSFVG
jgi:exopolysaccharide biosynthesis protein